MIFYDNYGFAVRIQRIISIDQRKDDQGICSVCYNLDGFIINRAYLSQAIADEVFRECLEKMIRVSEEDRGFEVFMRAHAKKGCEYQEKRVEEEGRGW